MKGWTPWLWRFEAWARSGSGASAGRLHPCHPFLPLTVCRGSVLLVPFVQDRHGGNGGEGDCCADAERVPGQPPVRRAAPPPALATPTAAPRANEPLHVDAVCLRPAALLPYLDKAAAPLISNVRFAFGAGVRMSCLASLPKLLTVGLADTSDPAHASRLLEAMIPQLGQVSCWLVDTFGPTVVARPPHARVLVLCGLRATCGGGGGGGCGGGGTVVQAVIRDNDMEVMCTAGESASEVMKLSYESKNPAILEVLKTIAPAVSVTTPLWPSVAVSPPSLTPEASTPTPVPVCADAWRGADDVVPAVHGAAHGAGRGRGRGRDGACGSGSG